MLEMAFATFLVTIALVAIGGRPRAARGTQSAFGFGTTGDGSDLPCPWCRAQTSESDDHCPNCGQRFG
jgi:hypothetical protein